MSNKKEIKQILVASMLAIICVVTIYAIGFTK
jgi:hypothetical protein